MFVSACLPVRLYVCVSVAVCLDGFIFVSVSISVSMYVYAHVCVILNVFVMHIGDWRLVSMSRLLSYLVRF